VELKIAVTFDIYDHFYSTEMSDNTNNLDRREDMQIKTKIKTLLMNILIKS